MTDRQRRRPAAVVTGEGGELAGRRKLAAALNATSNLPTNPGIILSWTVNPSVHNWFPSLALNECSLKQRPYDVLYTAS